MSPKHALSAGSFGYHRQVDRQIDIDKEGARIVRKRERARARVRRMRERTRVRVRKNERESESESEKE
jgi:hypothetical protein